ncbi:MAG: alpha/beta hydrolase [Planctomycetota bacterium]
MPRLAPTVLIALLALSPAALSPAGAQDPGPLPRVTWRVQLKGKAVGQEVVSVAAIGSAHVYRSHGELQITQTPFHYDQELRVAGPEQQLLGYALRSAQIQAAARPVAGGVELEVAYGAGQDAQRGKKVVAPGKGPFLLLDSLVPSHYEVLGALARRQDFPFPVVVLTPQSSAGLQGTFTPGRTFEAKVWGQMRSVREGRLAVGKLSATVVYDRERDAVYRVEDSQGYVAEVDGWPVPYREELVHFESGAEQIEATLTLPGGTRASAPTLLVLPGSGPGDRDQSIGPNKPLRDLARDLARRGVATLRYDKWGYRLNKVLSSGDRDRVRAARQAWVELTFAGEYLDDARAAIAWLSRRPEVSRVGVLGHSLGAVAAADVASLDSRVSAVVLLSGPARPMDELVVEQTAFQLGLTQPPKLVATQTRRMQDLFAKVRAGQLPDQVNVYGASAHYWREVLARPLLPELLKGLAQPVLVLQGSEDCQVSPERDYPRLVAALEARRREEDGHALLKGLNHLLMDTQGRKSTGLEYYLSRHELAPEVAKHVAQWLEKQWSRGKDQR